MKTPKLDEDEVLYGLRSSLAVFEQRPSDIRGIRYLSALRDELRELLHWASASGVPAEAARDQELAALAATAQHEGLVLRVRPRAWVSPKELGSWLVSNSRDAIAFDRVRNPQNIGAVLRSAAFFGVGGALLGAPAPHPGLPAFAARVAEGGAEHLVLSRTTDLADSLARLRASGVRAIGADAQSRSELASLKLGPCNVLVLGHEREGLSPRVRRECDALVGIQGSGAVESLNVAVAAGVLLSELTRSRRAH